MDPSQVASHDLEAWKRGQSAVCEPAPTAHRHDLAAQTAGSPHGHGVWLTARHSSALPIVYFDALGIPRLFAVL